MIDDASGPTEAFARPPEASDGRGEGLLHLLQRAAVLNPQMTQMAADPLSALHGSQPPFFIGVHL